MSKLLGIAEKTLRSQMERGLTHLRSVCTRFGLQPEPAVIIAALSAAAVEPINAASIAQVTAVAQHGPAAVASSTWWHAAASVTAGLGIAGAMAWSAWGVGDPPKPPPPPPEPQKDVRHIPVDVVASGTLTMDVARNPTLPDDHPAFFIGTYPDSKQIGAGAIRMRPSRPPVAHPYWLTHDMRPFVVPPIAQQDAMSPAIAGQPCHILLISPKTSWEWRPAAITSSTTRGIIIDVIRQRFANVDRTPLPRHRAWILDLGPMPAGTAAITVVERHEYADVIGPAHKIRSVTSVVTVAANASSPAAVHRGPPWSAAELVEENPAIPTIVGIPKQWQWESLAADEAAISNGLVLTGSGSVVDVGQWARSVRDGQQVPQASAPSATNAFALIATPIPTGPAGDPVAVCWPVYWHIATTAHGTVLHIDIWSQSARSTATAKPDDYGKFPAGRYAMTAPWAPNDPAFALRCTIVWRHLHDAGDGRGFRELPVPAAWTEHATWPPPHASPL